MAGTAARKGGSQEDGQHNDERAFHHPMYTAGRSRVSHGAQGSFRNTGPGQRCRVTFAAGAAYKGGMRIVGLFALVLCTWVAAGCGGSHVQPTALHGLYEPPLWLQRVVGREARLFHSTGPGGTSITRSKQNEVVEMFGEFTTPHPPACTTSYCPSPIRGHGTSLRLVISRRTHRVLSATLSQQIDAGQAPPIAQRSSRFLHIFLPHPGKVACSIPRGGLNITGKALRGRCTTQFVSSPPYPRGAIRVRFGERWRLGGHVQRAAWIVTVRYQDGRVETTRVIGQPPQLWK
jgi:hypothetical protein